MKLFELKDNTHPHQDIRIYGTKFCNTYEAKDIPEELEHKEIKCIYGGTFGVICVELED